MIAHVASGNIQRTGTLYRNQSLKQRAELNVKRSRLQNCTLIMAPGSENTLRHVSAMYNEKHTAMYNEK